MSHGWPSKSTEGVTMRNCARCGVPFLAYSRAEKFQRFCSGTCRTQAYRRRHPERQAKLFDVGPQFDGETIDVAQDQDRLGKQLDAVRCALDGGRWWTLSELSVRVRAPEASVSARIRDLRKERFGGHRIERRRVQDGNGLHEYRLEGGEK